jgi:uncharacterized protein (UPF0335 family)
MRQLIERIGRVEEASSAKSLAKSIKEWADHAESVVRLPENESAGTKMDLEAIKDVRRVIRLIDDLKWATG